MDRQIDVLHMAYFLFFYSYLFSPADPPGFSSPPPWQGWKNRILLTTLGTVSACAHADNYWPRLLKSNSLGNKSDHAMLIFIFFILLAMLLIFWCWRERQQARRMRQLHQELNALRQREAALRENEARFRDVAEATSDWIWEMDEQLRFTYFSERFQALTGIPMQDVLGLTRWELAGIASSADSNRWRQHRETLENHLPFRDFVYQTQRMGDQPTGRYLKVSGKPIYDAQGQFRGYRGTGADITEHAKAEAALHQSELRLRRIIDLVPHMIFARDRHGHFLLANRATATAYGATVESLTNPVQPVSPASGTTAGCMLADDRTVLETWESRLIPETTFTDHAGHVRTLQILQIPFLEPEVNEAAVLSVAIDITDQQSAKKAIARMRVYLKSMIDSMPSVLIGVNPWGYITVLNQLAEQSCGLSWEAAQGRFFESVFPQLEGQFEHVRQAILHRNPIKIPRMTLEMQGELHYADVVVYPLITESSDGAVIRLDDVSARVRLESMMVQTEKMLSIGGLAAGMAHEINNPLGAILQGIQNILRRIGPGLPQNHAVADALGVDLVQINRYLHERNIPRLLEGIREAGIRSAKIIADMLSFSRPSEARFTPVGVAAMLETVLRLAASDYDLKKKHDFKHIKIERDYDPMLRTLYCDKTEIEQVLLNLLKNAAQAMTEGGTPSPTITLRTVRETDCAVIEVIDNGPGMEEKILKRIFEPFFTTKELGVGTGLGLSVSYFIVTEQHGGRLLVTSKPGQGTCFSIRLPLVRERPS